MNIKKLDFDSIYFDLYKLDSGIYAAISADKFPQSSNAGFFDLGNHLIIFDTLFDPFATDDLIRASKQFTNKEPSFLINSHFHLDHLLGNRKFPMEIPIISSVETLLEFQEKSNNNLNQLKEIGPQELKRIEEKLKKETNPNKILEMKNDISTYSEIKNPNFKLRAPDFIINDSIVIEGVENKVQIIYIGAAHTRGDIIGYFDKEKICFMGDLLFEKTDPSWASRTTGMPFAVDPERVRNFLMNYIDKNIEVYVPGHGNLCSKKELQKNIEFLEEYYIK